MLAERSRVAAFLVRLSRWSAIVLAVGLGILLQPTVADSKANPTPTGTPGGQPARRVIVVTPTPVPSAGEQAGRRIVVVTPTPAPPGPTPTATPTPVVHCLPRERVVGAGLATTDAPLCPAGLVPVLGEVAPEMLAAREADLAVRPAATPEMADAEGEPVAEETADETAERRRRLVELGNGRVMASLDLGQYADRLARLNGWLVSPFGDIPLTSRMIKFGYLGDYGPDLAFAVRGEEGVALLGTLHLGLDLQITWLPDGGRGAPVVAPFDGRIIRTSDPIGGPHGIWLENANLNLRARLMHMDALVVGIDSGVWVQAGQQIGILGAQGSEGFPHLHLAFERMTDGARINPALFYRLRDWSDRTTAAGEWFDDPSRAPVVALRQPRSTPVEEAGPRVAAFLRSAVGLPPDLPWAPLMAGRFSMVQLAYP